MLKPEFQECVPCILFCTKLEFIRHVALPQIPECKMVLLQVLCKKHKLKSAVVSVLFLFAAEAAETCIGVSDDIAYLSCDHETILFHVSGDQLKIIIDLLGFFEYLTVCWCQPALFVVGSDLLYNRHKLCRDGQSG